MQEFLLILKWWFAIFLVGTVFLPLTLKLFENFFDRGYIFSKILGILFISYAALVLGITHIAPFTRISLILFLILLLIFNLSLILKINNGRLKTRDNFLITLKERWIIFVFEETLFFLALLFWSFIRAHMPEIHGLEKYMDFGFVNSILRSTY